MVVVSLESFVCHPPLQLKLSIALSDGKDTTWQLMICLIALLSASAINLVTVLKLSPNYIESQRNPGSWGEKGSRERDSILKAVLGRFGAGKEIHVTLLRSTWHLRAYSSQIRMSILSLLLGWKWCRKAYWNLFWAIRAFFLFVYLPFTPNPWILPFLTQKPATP